MKISSDPTVIRAAHLYPVAGKSRRLRCGAETSARTPSAGIQTCGEGTADTQCLRARVAAICALARTFDGGNRMRPIAMVDVSVGEPLRLSRLLNLHRLDAEFSAVAVYGGRSERSVWHGRDDCSARFKTVSTRGQAFRMQSLQLPDELRRLLRAGSVILGVKLRDQGAPCDDSLPVRVVSIFCTTGFFERGDRLHLVTVIDEGSRVPVTIGWRSTCHGVDPEFTEVAMTAGAAGRVVRHAADCATAFRERELPAVSLAGTRAAHLFACVISADAGVDTLQLVCTPATDGRCLQARPIEVLGPSRINDPVDQAVVRRSKDVGGGTPLSTNPILRSGHAEICAPLSITHCHRPHASANARSLRDGLSTSRASGPMRCEKKRIFVFHPRPNERIGRSAFQLAHAYRFGGTPGSLTKFGQEAARG